MYIFSDVFVGMDNLGHFVELGVPMSLSVFRNIYVRGFISTCVAILLYQTCTFRIKQHNKLILQS